MTKSEKPVLPLKAKVLAMINGCASEPSATQDCANPWCPLNRVKAGIAVRIKQLCAAPQVADRLREIGFCEDQIVRLLTSHTNIICMVCNTRLALSSQIAETILVEPVRVAA
jgi:Fe2+ transport system protein FeoA